MKAVRVITGRAVPLRRNDVDTDQIIPAEWLKRVERTGFEKGLFSTWRDDRDFVLNDERYTGATILLAGTNFGTGSSREQAATCLQHFGIPCVIAHSFSETYKRNAFNNGFVVFECPELVAWLADKYGGPGGPAQASPQTAVGAATVIGPDVVIDYRASTITCDGRTFAFPPLSVVAQELVVAGGAENVVKKRLAAMA